MRRAGQGGFVRTSLTHSYSGMEARDLDAGRGLLLDALMRLLIAEDDSVLAWALQRTFEKRGCTVSLCHDGMAVMGAVAGFEPDVMILDLGLPGLDGLAILSRLRQAGNDVPVMVITGRQSVGDRVQTFGAGADDYLSKPFDIDELDARIRALARRCARHRPEPVRVGRLRLQPDSGAIHRDDDVLELSPREQAFLGELMMRAGEVVARDRLHRAVFTLGDPARPQALDVVAHRVRRKIVGSGVRLRTLRAVGYMLSEEA